MTNHRLTIKPLTKQQAEQTADILESRFSPAAQVVSLSEYNGGTVWQIDAYYTSIEEAQQGEAFAGSLGIAKDSLSISAIDNEDWVSHSLRGLKPVTAGRFFVHGSHDRNARPQHGAAIEIDAATAFGTGHHATTLGCLLMLDRILLTQPQSKILDIGCGSGILAIAAARLARHKVLACDIDPEAVRVTRVNAAKNGARVTAVVAAGPSHRAIAAGVPFDLVMANILAGPLAELAPVLGRIAATHGLLLLSGILTEQQQWIERTYRHWGFVAHRRLDIEGWSTLLLGRGKKKRPRG